jgi:Phage integrase family
VSPPLKTTLSARDPRFSGELEAALVARLADRVVPDRPTDFVVSLDGGAPVDPDAMTRWLTSLALPSASGPPHRLRHTSATLMLNAGIPIETVGKVLDHRDVRTTSIYARVLDETSFAALDSLAALLQPPDTDVDRAAGGDGTTGGVTSDVVRPTRRSVPERSSVSQVILTHMLDNQVATTARTHRRRRTVKSEMPTRWILERVIFLLATAAAFLALGAFAQVLLNHSSGASPKNYYYADAVLQAVAYGFVAAAFFIGWVNSGRSTVFTRFSLPLMLAFLGAACIAAQWIMVLLDYIEEFHFNAAYLQSIKHLIDASAVLQLCGWGAVACALAVSLHTLITKPAHAPESTAPGLQFWHRGPTRAS